MTEPPTLEKIRCDACPVMCYIAEGRVGACDRYANQAGVLVRLDPLTVLTSQAPLVPFLGADGAEQDWDGDVIKGHRTFVTAIGAGTTYPDYKPAPFIVSQQVDGVDMVTVVTEGIFSYCGVKVKIDTDRHIGAERAMVRVAGEGIGHVMTGDALLRLCNREAVAVQIDDGARLVVQAGQPPVINGVPERLMRVGCGSATIGMFAQQWLGLADEVVVVDDHITGVLSEHQAGRMLNVPATGIRMKGRRSTPGRYFQVAAPGTGWGGTNIDDPLSILKPFDPKRAWPGLRLLMISTTGEQWAYYELDESLLPVRAEAPAALRASADRIAENCEPSLCSVLFMGGAGGSLRAGVTTNPVRLTRSVKDTLTHVSCGGAEAYVWPGGGITFMVDVMKMPGNSFGYVPTPALVAPIEFTLRLADYAALGGHIGQVRPVESVLTADIRQVAAAPGELDPQASANFPWGKSGRQRS